MQVVAVALEHAMRFDMDLHVQVAVRRAVTAGLAMAAVAKAHAAVDTCRDLDLQRLLFLDSAGAVAVLARRTDLFAAAVAARAGLLDGEEALLHAHLAVTRTGLAGGGAGAGFGAGTAAGLALFHDRNAYLFFRAACRFFQRDLHVVAQVGAAVGLAAPAAAAAEDVAEDVAEVEALGAARTERAAAAHSARFECRVTVLVVSSTFLSVGQSLVGFLRFLELFLRFRIIRIAVGVVLHRQLTISLLDVFLGRVAVDAEDFVVVFFAH
ncbi:hypothetical protein GALL_214920 [mine drainage metagenome]|uniref:Uncharacterized protein n=1 Tax=mine drainage metagenome TaxID=410659 RepID=A0A1J5S3X6_9ZZZZ